MIKDSLYNKNRTERSEIKATEIAKLDFLREHVDLEKGITIDIRTVNKIQNGIEVFARVFRNGKQLGFGIDGSVDIERFRIFNPPILVDDKNGDIVRSYYDKYTRKTTYRKLKEDPVEAIKQTLSHTASIVGKEGTKITKGKIGNTTTTVYPSMDGYVQRSLASTGGNESFSTIRSGAGDYEDDTGNNMYAPRLISDNSLNQWSDLMRGYLLFDTSGIVDTDNITAATLSIYGHSKSTAHFSLVHNICSSAPASDSALAASDYAVANFGSTKFSTGIGTASWNTAGYNDFVLNASGLANITKTGISKFGLRFEQDIDNSSPTWTSAQDEYVFSYSADLAGTSNDPKLVITHTPASTAYSVTVDSGSYALTGVSATTTYGRIIPAGTAAFVYTGNDASLSDRASFRKEPLPTNSYTKVALPNS